MEKVFVVECVDEWDGQVSTDIDVFRTFDEARECMRIMKDKDYQFIDDVKELIKEGNIDCTIDDTDDYFYCYDAFNFSAKTITITEKEVK